MNVRGGVSPLLRAQRLRKTFATSGHGTVSSSSGDSAAAVDDVSVEIRAGETLGIVGESGSGKTTLARILMRLIEPDSGEIKFQGQDWLAARGKKLRTLRRQMQMIFQDPASSLDPRMLVEETVGEPLAIHEPRSRRAERGDRIREMLRAVGLGEETLRRFPHEFSGGQRQRICIARALILRPALVVADEPVTALDVSVGAQILELLSRLQKEFSVTYLLISHSLPVVAQLAQRVAVMRAGKIVEQAATEALLNRPEHPYTRALLDAVPDTSWLS